MFKSSIFISFTDNPDKTEPYVCKAAYTFKQTVVKVKNTDIFFNRHTFSFVRDQMCLANSELISNEPNKSTQFSNSSLLIEWINESNWREVTEAGPNIFNASQLI